MTNSSSAESTGTWRLIQPEQVLDMAINDVEFLTELIDLFVALAPEQMQDIRQAIDSNDAGLLAEVAHAYKGTVGNYTQTGPYPLLQSLENDGKSADLQASQSKFQTLEQEINALLTELETLKTEVNQSL
ncbi:Hpt domain-containing protein [Gimesia chilikensis]|uniref:Hpt domain-containing protein n=1 Tax=Gimesia chilikensis TaxID=2605989 RepID=UPI00118BB974|nr:Hpt domain-containing protein [Gimesia chilikensis]MCR9230482.1 Hpt domain-containing protein [bacterium]QDT87069.1 Hpt domain protein [Gimesia chilikensis]